MSKRADKPRVAVVVSDIHCGSTVGLMPPDFVTLEGNKLKQNAIQQWLWACWLDVQKRLTAYLGGDSYILIVNGDTIEGVHHGTKEVITPQVTDHDNAAREVLEPLAERAAKRFVIEGTECHTGATEHGLGKHLKAERDEATGRYAFTRLRLNFCGTPCLFEHHVSTTSRPYLAASALSIKEGVETIEAVDAGAVPPRVIGVGHRHRFGQYRSAERLVFVSPAWQGLTRHGRKVVPAARLAPGIIVLDWRNRPDGDLPTCEPIMCKPPPERPVTA